MSVLTTLRRRRPPRLDPPALAAEGDSVWISSSRVKERLRGRVARSQPSALTIVLMESPPAPLRRRTRIELEWIERRGLVCARGRIDALEGGPPPALQVRLKGGLRLAERRGNLRVGVSLNVSGWSLQDPTRLLSGETVDLSDGGALLRLPSTPEAATALELRISFPDGALSALGHVVRRALDDLVAVRLEPEHAEDRERLARFVSARLRDTGASREPLP